MCEPKQINCLIESDDEDLAIGKDWAKVEETTKNSGYRIGLEVNQEQTLQFGFNSGFREALHLAFAGGKLQGEILARMACLDSGKTSEPFGKESPRPTSQETDHKVFESLNSVLTANSKLMSNIPTYLAPSIRNLSSYDTVDKQFSPVRSDESTSSAVAVKQSGVCESQSKVTDQKGSSACDAVCDNHSTFWSQLESFRIQAGALDSHLQT